jgi:hypothetical protein
MNATTPNQPKNAGRLPAFQFYPADWRKDPSVQALDYETRGIWFEMLCLMHESDERGVLLLNGNPMPEDALCRLLGLDKQILTTALTKLLAYGVAKERQEDKAIFSKRMVHDEYIRQIRKNAGFKGGNPLLLKQNTTTGVKQKPTPSSSSSSSSSSSYSKEDKKLPRQARLDFPDSFSEERKASFSEWMRYKAEKRQPYKPTGWKALLSKFNNLSDFQINAAIQNSMAGNWSGIFESSNQDQVQAAPPKPKRKPNLPINWQEIAADYFERPIECDFDDLSADDQYTLQNHISYMEKSA